MNQTLFELVNGWVGRHGWLDAIGVFCAEHLIYAMALGVICLASWYGKRGWQLMFLAGLSAVSAWCIAALLKVVFATTRPFATLGDAALLVSPIFDASFPSGHATAAFAIATAVWCWSRAWGAVFFAAALLVAWGRIFVGVHWPADVVAGSLLGMVVALACAGALHFTWHRDKSKVA